MNPASPIPDRVRMVSMPPIDALNTRMAEINAAGGDVISLGQSVPFFGPPPEMVEAVMPFHINHSLIHPTVFLRDICFNVGLM